MTLAALGAAGIAVDLWLQLRSQPAAEAPPAQPPAEPPPPPPDRLELAPATFTDLPGWQADPLADALPALACSCRVFAARPATAAVGPAGLAGTAAAWRAACRAAAAVPRGDHAAARRYLEAHFEPWAASNHGEPTGLFTGYYEPTLRGSKRRGGRYKVPLHLRPRDLVTVDLGLFRDDLKGRRLAGRLERGTLLPYFDRLAIERGALAGRGLEVVWVDDPIDAFFLQIQGSGRVELAGGGVLRLGYAGGNGQPYFAIGKALVERGVLKKEEASMQAIRRWLADHPTEAPAVMGRNPSYVFFRRLEGEGPLGALGVALTPGRSLAVDSTFLPLGAPLYLDATAPSPNPALPDRPLQRLLLAQDTGGAITGPLRGDVFWGPGPDAAEIAGRMKHRGRLWVLLPKGVVAN